MAFGNPQYAWPHNGTNVGGLITVRILTSGAGSTSDTEVFEGNLIVFQNSGYVKLGGYSEAANDLFAGVAAESRSWVKGESDGETANVIHVKVWTEGEFDLYHADAAITDVGAAFGPTDSEADYGACAVDDYDAATNNVTVGVCVGFPATDRVRIKIDSCASAYEGLAF